MPAFSEDDFADCTITGMKLDYAVHYETETETGISGEWWDVNGKPQEPGYSFIRFDLYYYLNAEEARGYYQQAADQLRESCKILANNGVDKLLQCDVSDNEATIVTSQVTSQGTYYFGSNYRVYDEHYFFFFQFELHPPATEQQAWDTLAQTKDCIVKVINKKDRKFFGNVTNAWGEKLPGMVVKLTYDGNEYETTTDENGTYRIAFEGTFGKQARLSFLMQCYDKETGKVLLTINTDHATDAPYQFDQNFTVKDENDLQHDFVAMNDLQGSEFMGYVYYGMIEAIAVYVREFGEEEFASRIQEVIIRPYATNKYSAYQEETNSIVISDRHTVFTDYVSLFRPPELEFHEYSHHVMKSYYGQLPAAPADSIVPEINHEGYINPSTADSFVEGFAIFMAQIIREKADYPDPGVDYLLGSLEVNTRAWDGCGGSEDLAVAGIFWDLYDGVDAADEDTVQLALQEIWGVLKNSKANMYEVYQKFVNDFPDKKPGIDRIFVNHGFFADTDRGNGTYDKGEPLRGSIPNNDYYYVDLANPMVWDNRKQDGQVLGEKETIGQATNYQRPERYYTPPKPFQYIKTSDTYPFYKVTVSFSGNPALNYELITELQEDGLIPVSIPPETYQATISVAGCGEGVTTGAPLSFTNQEFIAGYGTTIAQGYYTEHVFQITGTAPPRPVTDPALTNPGQNKCLASKLLGKQDKRLNILRRFRDEVLVKSSIGKQLVKIYYEKSKPVVEALEGHEFCRTIAAALLGKIIPVIEMTLT